MSKYRNISDYKILRARAEEMLLNPTKSEKKLRIALLNKFPEAEFKFQVVMIPFIVDNVSIKHRLIIEVDGSIHDSSLDADEVRQKNLEADGYRFLRFTNSEIHNNLDNVLQLIEFNLQKPIPAIQRTPYARTKKSRRFNRPPYPTTIGDRSIIDPVSGKPYTPDTDDEIDEMAEDLANEIATQKSETERKIHRNLEKLNNAIFRKQKILETNKSKKFICYNCKCSINFSEPRTAYRVNGEFTGWIHIKC